MPSHHLRTLFTCLVTSLLLTAPMTKTFAAPKGKKQKHLTVQRISPPTMVSPSAKTASLRTAGTVQLSVKLVYAHTRAQQHTDRSLRRALPKLSHITGFNAYQLLRRIRRRIPYNQPISIRISKRFMVKLTPKGYIARSRSIALQATFLYRIRKGKKRGQLAAYATTDLRLKSGRQIAFVGPAHRDGRAILLLTATKK